MTFSLRAAPRRFNKNSRHFEKASRGTGRIHSQLAHDTQLDESLYTRFHELTGGWFYRFTGIADGGTYLIQRLSCCDVVSGVDRANNSASKVILKQLSTLSSPPPKIYPVAMPVTNDRPVMPSTAVSAATGTTANGTAVVPATPAATATPQPNVPPKKLSKNDQAWRGNFDLVKEHFRKNPCSYPNKKTQ